MRLNSSTSPIKSSGLQVTQPLTDVKIYSSYGIGDFSGTAKITSSPGQLLNWKPGRTLWLIIQTLGSINPTNSEDLISCADIGGGTGWKVVRAGTNAGRNGQIFVLANAPAFTFVQGLTLPLNGISIIAIVWKASNNVISMSFNGQALTQYSAVNPPANLSASSTTQIGTNSGSGSDPLTTCRILGFAVTPTEATTTEVALYGSPKGNRFQLATGIKSAAITEFQADRDWNGSSSTIITLGSSPITLNVSGTPSFKKISEARYPVTKLLTEGKSKITLSDVNSISYDLHDCFAHTKYITDARSVGVEETSSMTSLNLGWSVIGLYVNGVFQNESAATHLSSTLNETLEIQLPSGTSKLIDLVDGPQSVYSNNRVGTMIQAVRIPLLLSDGITSTNTTSIKPSVSEDVIVGLGDSINVGFNSSPITQYSTWSQLRKANAATTSVICCSQGSESLNNVAGTPELMTATINRIILQCTGSKSNTIWLALGTNDYGFNYLTSSAFGILYGQFLDALYTAAVAGSIPGFRVVCQTPIQRISPSNETDHGAGTLSAFRTAISNCCASRSWTILVDGASGAIIPDTSINTDGLHLTNLGAAQFANKIAYTSGLIDTSNKVLLNYGMVADFNATTITGVSDGTTISTWSSSVGNITTSVPSGGAAPVYLATGWSDAEPAISFSNATKQCLGADSLASYATNNGVYTVAVLLRRSSTGDMFPYGVSNGVLVYHYGDLNQNGATNGATLSGTVSSITSSLTTKTYTDNLVIFISNGSSSAVYVDGVKVTGNASDSAGVVFNRFVLGGLAYNNSIHPSTFNGLIRRFVVWNRALSDADLTAVRSVIFNIPIADSNGLVANFDASQITGISNGAAIAKWNSTVVSTLTAAQLSGSNKPIYNASSWASDNGPAITFTKSSRQYFTVDQLAALSNNTGPLTIAAWIRRAPNTTLNAGEGLNDIYIAGVSDGSSGNYRYFEIPIATQVTAIQANNPTLTASGGIIPTGGDALVVFINNGLNNTIWVNGRKFSSTSGVSITAANYSKFEIGGLFFNGTQHPTYFDGKMRKLMVWNKALTDPEVLTLHQNYSYLAKGIFDVIALGDSMTVGSSWAANYTKPSAQANSTVYAQSGRTLISNSYDAGNDVFDNLSGMKNSYSKYQPQVVVIFAGGNDCYYGVTGTQALNNLSTVISSIKANNPYDYIVVVVPPDRLGWSSSPAYATFGGVDSYFNNNMTVFRNGILSGNYGDAVWNLYSLLPNANDTTYFNVDKVHPNATGQNLIASDFTSRIAAWGSSAVNMSNRYT